MDRASEGGVEAAPTPWMASNARDRADGAADEGPRPIPRDPAAAPARLTNDPHDKLTAGEGAARDCAPPLSKACREKGEGGG